MFNKVLRIPTYMVKEGAEELEKLGVKVEGLGEVEMIPTWNVIECCEHEIDGVEGTLFFTGNGGGMFSPLSEDNFVKLVDDHLEKYGRR